MHQDHLNYALLTSSRACHQDYIPTRVYGVGVKLTTLGRVHLSGRDGEEVALQPLPLALLTYLAVGGPRDREHLCDLFWPSGKNRLNSLSTTLNRIRAEVPDGVWAQGNTLVGIDVASDLVDLREAIDRSDFDAISTLYNAPFLENLRLRRQSAEFESWVLAERAALAAKVELALLDRGRKLYDSGDHHAAAQLVEEAWDITLRDGFPSPAHFEVYHQLLAAAARPSVHAVRSMAEEIGIELEPLRPMVFEAAADDVKPNAAPLPTQPVGHQGTGASTPLFGCQDELDAIAKSVASKKLTTLVGLGGSGKTRLAAEFFGSSHTVSKFPHRHWVNLQDVTDPDLVGPAIATSLDHRFENVKGLAEWLPDDEPVLLVLDNFEQIVESAHVADELLSGNDALRILATSRVPLEVPAESLVRLGGLDTSDDEADSPAAQLFMSSARRAGVDDGRLSGAHLGAIGDVCRSVGGNPLALEIVGSWAQILSPTEILSALEVDNELLGSPMAGHLRSMNAVLEQSWLTLDESEQNCLMLLATFPSGFRTSEAVKLNDVSIASIGRLVQHSLVRLEVEGRISLHPLIAAHALGELEQRANLHDQFLRVRSDWCRTFATTKQSTSPIKHGLDAEVANFAAAWLSDAQLGRWELHHATLAPLRQFFNESGRVSEARSLFTSLADALRSHARPPQDLLSATLEALGWFEVLAGELPQAQTHLDEAFALSSTDNPRAQAQTLRSMGVLQLNTGEIGKATANFEAGLALVDDDADSLMASIQYDLAQAHHFSGARDEAITSARLALQSSRSTNNWAVMTTSYLLLADIEVESDPEHAIVLLNEGWEIATNASLENLAIYFPLVLGLAHLGLNETKVAQKYFTDGIEAAGAVRQLATVCANYIGRAECHLAGKRVPDAIADLQTGIRLALKTGAVRYLLWATVVSCRVPTATAQAASPFAKDLLVLVLAHPASDQATRDKAAEALQDLFDDDAETVLDRPANDDHGGSDLSLDEIAERALQLLTSR